MSASLERREIDDSLLDWMGESGEDDNRDERFERLALRLFRHQVEQCRPYARYCEAIGVAPDTVRRWQDIPAVPTGAFKETQLRSFPADQTRKIFRTSGTSGERRGELHLDSLELYEASLLWSLRRALFPDLGAGERIALRVLAQSPVDATDSSLSHMFGAALETFGNDASGYDVRGGSLDTGSFLAAIAACRERGEAVAVCGTSFAFVHLLDAVGADTRLDLPPGSRAMETGGFKGRSREVAPTELRTAISDLLGVPETAVVNQYGMTELGSQFYDSTLVDPGGPRRKLGPPWVRVRLIDPESGEQAAPGESGMITIHDLANTGSVAAIQTADLGRRIEAPGSPQGHGFVVLGRMAGAEERGCSIASDVMLGDAG